MTVKELITKLLDYDANYEVLLLSDSDPEDDCSGVLFHIEDVRPWGKQPQIYFKDWRHEIMKEKMEEGEIYDIDYQQPCEDCKVKKDAYIQGYDYGVKDWFKSKTQPCEDCISREDALKAIEEQKKGFYGVERYAIDECHSAVMKLPSVRTSQCDDTTSQCDGKTSQCDNDVTTCDTEKEKEKEKETNTETYIEKDSDLKSDLNSDSEIHEDKRACEKCIHYVTRDGCDSWECDFEEVKT